MALRDILSPVTLGPAAGAMAALDLALGVTVTESLEPPDYELEDQKGEFLCWAAVGSSVGARVQAPGGLSQCGIVKKMKEWCENCEGSKCDRMGNVVIALGTQGLGAVSVPGAPANDSLLEEIKNGRPVVCLMLPEPLKPHFVVIISCDSEGSIQVRDPSREDKHWQGSWPLSVFAGSCDRHILVSAV